MFTNIGILLKSIPVFLPFLKEILLGRRKNVGGKAPNVLRPWIALLCIGLAVAIAIAVNNFFTGFRTQNELESTVHKLKLEAEALKSRNKELGDRLEAALTAPAKCEAPPREEPKPVVDTKEVDELKNKLAAAEEELSKRPVPSSKPVAPPRSNHSKISTKTHAILQEALE